MNIIETCICGQKLTGDRIGTGFCSPECEEEFNSGDNSCWVCGDMKSEEIWDKYKQNYCCYECMKQDSTLLEEE